ncbi:MAG: tetratricopeptide repeat protein [Planctomycetes bacterium]|nr:tetratricopeptide repeat protein [Planctomycetota bacterium]
MLTPRRLITTGIVVAALTLFAMPLTQVDAQRSTRGGSSGPALGGSGSRSAPAPAPRASSPAPAPRATPAPAPRASSPAPAPRASSPAPAPRASSPAPTSRASSPAPSARDTTPSRSSAPAPSARDTAPSRSSAPAPSSRDDSQDLPRSTYRSAPATRTPSGVPTIEPERSRVDTTRASNGSGISRADNVSRTAVRPDAPSAGRATETRRDQPVTAAPAASRTRGITERSTISDFSTTRSTTADRSATTVATSRNQTQEMLAGPSWHVGYGYAGSYYGHGWRTGHHHSWGVSWHLGGGWSIGFSSGWYGRWCWNSGWGWGWGRHIHVGSFATAILVGTAWHIVAHQGYWGWYGGSHCYWVPNYRWNTCDTFYYGGHYCRVNRPYWYGYTRWYDYRPYSYGYSSLVYDDLYDDGYDDGYKKGYNRGYHDGADEAGGLKDDRRRDSIGKASRPRVPDAAEERARGNALAQFRTEMNRGGEAFKKGDYSAATRAFKEAAIVNPESADARYMLSTSAMAEGKYAFSAFALRRGMALDAEGSNLDLPRMFGGPDAVRAQRDAIAHELKNSPQDVDLLLLQGFVALRSGDAGAAAAALDKALQHNPQDAAAKKLHREAMDALEQS